MSFEKTHLFCNIVLIGCSRSSNVDDFTVFTSTILVQIESAYAKTYDPQYITLVLPFQTSTEDAPDPMSEREGVGVSFQTTATLRNSSGGRYIKVDSFNIIIP